MKNTIKLTKLVQFQMHLLLFYFNTMAAFFRALGYLRRVFCSCGEEKLVLFQQRMQTSAVREFIILLLAQK
jgi:hypothetical protein